jgi:hypothetical protein
VNGVFAAETAVLVHLKTLGCVFFVLYGVVIALLAFVASQGNLYSHLKRHLLIDSPEEKNGLGRFASLFALGIAG